MKASIIKRIVLTQLLVLLLSVLFAQNKTFTTNLPIVFLNTNGKAIVDDPRVIVEMEIAWKGEGKTNTTSDPRTHFSGDINIEIRGSTSQQFPKKSFGFELKNEEGKDMDFPLLGMPEEEDWILYAPYSDKTLIRNVLALTLASQISDVYVPRCRFVELFINEKYHGVYVLMEKIKRDKNRVDIAKLKAGDIEGEELTGGYIIKIDKITGSGGDRWYSKRKNSNGARTYYQYEYPKFDKITPEQKQYIEKYFDDFETAVFNKNHDEQTGYMSFIHPESFFDMIIINELSKNIDGYRLSTFLYKDKNDKLTAGPLWDYNLAFGNANYHNGWDTRFLQVFELLGKDLRKNPFWWTVLMRDSVFTNPFKTRWQELRKNQLSEERVLAVADSLINLLGQAADRNFERWPILGEQVVPNYFVGDTYESEVNWLKSWITDRLVNLDDRLPGIGKVTDSPVLNVGLSKIYPNPFNQKITVQIQAECSSLCYFRLLTVNGQVVKDVQFNVSKGFSSFEINTGNLQNGVYIYQLQNGDAGVSIGKIIKL